MFFWIRNLSRWTNLISFILYFVKSQMYDTMLDDVGASYNQLVQIGRKEK